MMKNETAELLRRARLSPCDLEVRKALVAGLLDDGEVLGHVLGIEDAAAVVLGRERIIGVLQTQLALGVQFTPQMLETVLRWPKYSAALLERMQDWNCLLFASYPLAFPELAFGRRPHPEVTVEDCRLLEHAVVPCGWHLLTRRQEQRIQFKVRDFVPPLALGLYAVQMARWTGRKPMFRDQRVLCSDGVLTVPADESAPLDVQASSLWAEDIAGDAILIRPTEDI